MHDLDLLKKKISDIPKLRDILQNDGSVLIKNVKVTKGKGKNEELSQVGKNQRDTAKFSVGHWIGSRNRKRTWGRSHGEIQGLQFS